MKKNKHCNACLAVMKRWGNVNHSILQLSSSCGRTFQNIKNGDLNSSLSKEGDLPTVRVSDIAGTCIESYEFEQICTNHPMAFFTSNVYQNLFVNNQSVLSVFLKPSSLQKSDNKGFAFNLSVLCENCYDFTVSSFTSNKIGDSDSFDVNRRTVMAFTDMGKGHKAVEEFCMIMNMSVMSSKTFHKHSKSSVKSSEEQLQEARRRVREVYQENDCSMTQDSVIDIGASYDGTWHKRGHTSNYGVGCVIASNRSSHQLLCTI